MAKVRGFTLIELMVVVAVIAVLAAIALPLLNEQLRKSKRTEAIQAIADIQQQEEKWRSYNTGYGILASVITPSSTANYNGALKYYDITVPTNTTTTYSITATRKGQMASDPKCGNFTLNYGTDCSAGATAGVANKCISAGDADYCWRRK